MHITFMILYASTKKMHFSILAIYCSVVVQKLPRYDETDIVLSYMRRKDAHKQFP